jgi:hypothetical protein
MTRPGHALLYIRWVAPAALVLAASTAHGGTISFTPVPYVDMTQPFLPGQAPATFTVRLENAVRTTIGSMDLIIGTPLGDGSRINIPYKGGFMAAFPLNSFRHNEDTPCDFPSCYEPYPDYVKVGGFAFVPQTTAAGILIGTLSIDPLIEPGRYTFGVSSTIDRNRSRLVGYESWSEIPEPLFGSVTLTVIPEPVTLVLVSLGAAVGLVRRRRR